MIQESVRALELLGPLPSEDDATDEILRGWEALLKRVHVPISNDDALVLAGLFGPDLCYGLGWSLLHIVETAPNWPVEGATDRMPQEWSERVMTRFRNAQNDE